MKDKTIFMVSKPVEIPIKRFKYGGRSVDTDLLTNFWKEFGSHADQRGCYVFSMRKSGGQKPWYVGKAAKQAFHRECFTDHKMQHYSEILGNNQGKPFLTLVFQKKNRGKWSLSAIDEIEEYLIALAASRNSNLSNKKRLPYQKWCILGVESAGQGAPTKEAKLFKEIMF